MNDADAGFRRFAERLENVAGQAAVREVLARAETQSSTKRSISNFLFMDLRPPASLARDGPFNNATPESAADAAITDLREIA
ncbi:MAG TPA: hypothetical protein PKH09_09775 [Parvularculaceae bacterium]|nr:hypothetical protein [Parvularculaceae bacterium]